VDLHKTQVAAEAAVG